MHCRRVYKFSGTNKSCAFAQLLALRFIDEKERTMAPRNFAAEPKVRIGVLATQTRRNERQSDTKRQTADRKNLFLVLAFNWHFVWIVRVCWSWRLKKEDGRHVLLYLVLRKRSLIFATAFLISVIVSMIIILCCCCCFSIKTIGRCSWWRKM